MAFPIILLVLLYSHNIILFYYSIPMLVAFLTRTLNEGTIDFPLLHYYWIYIVWAVLFIIYFICNIIFLNINVKNKNVEKIKNYCKIIKYYSIPFWIMNIISYIGLIIAFFFIMFGWVIIFIPIPIFISYIILLATSSYSISYLIIMKRNGSITKKQFIKNIILQLCFIFDIIGIIILFKKEKKMSNGT